MSTLALDIKNEEQRSAAQKSTLAALKRFIPKAPPHFRIARYFNNALHVSDRENLIIQYDADVLGLTEDHKYENFRGSPPDTERVTAYVTSRQYTQEVKLPVKELTRALKAARAFSTREAEVPRLSVAAGRATVSLQSVLGDYQHTFGVDVDAFIYNAILPAPITKLLASVKDKEAVISACLYKGTYFVRVHMPYTNRSLYYIHQ